MNKSSKIPKIAIFYDWLNNWGGAERVLLSLLKLYPQAEIYTLVHDPQKTPWLPKNIPVHTSFLNQFLFSKTNPLIYTILYTLAIEQFDFSNFDIVISTTSTIGHGLLTPPQTLLVCYFHNINRYVYSTPPIYQPLLPLLKLYQIIDKIFIKRPDYFFCNSQTVATRLSQHYHIHPTIINPGINLKQFTTISHPELGYFLIVGRQVPHKRIDIVIKCFLSTPSRKLIIAGSGRANKKLRQLAQGSTNIKFISHPSDQQLIKLYQNCQALICPQLEDYGLTPIEAQACGRPVIAYNQGGNKETIIAGQTGIFFAKQTVASLSAALAKFASLSFSPITCHQNAQNFSERSFMLNFRHHLSILWTKHQTTISS